LLRRSGTGSAARPEKRGHHFARYADDCNIYVRSQKAGERVLAGIERFLEKRL
jgi:RNA-directed DNA polymerase